MLIAFNQGFGNFCGRPFGDWEPSVLRLFATGGTATDPRFCFSVNGCRGAAAVFAPALDIAALAFPANKGSKLVWLLRTLHEPSVPRSHLWHPFQASHRV